MKVSYKTSFSFSAAAMLCLALALLSVPVVNAQSPTTTVKLRDRFSANVYFGGAYDNFSGPVSKYINYDEDESTWRMTGGILFDYGIWSSNSGLHSLWATGKTIRGVRAAEVDCSAEDDADKPALCGDLSGFPANAQDRARYLLRNASSFEGSIGMRYEFKLDGWGGNLTQDTFPGSSLFINVEMGGASVKDDDNDIAEISNIGTGVIIRDGRFRGSFFEIGRGKNEIFIDDPTGRLKIKVRAMLNDIGFGIADKKPFGLFVQLNVDADNGPGADSIQTYVGFHAALRSLF